MWAELSKKPSFDAYLEMIGKQVDDMRCYGSTYAQGKAVFETMPWPSAAPPGVHLQPQPMVQFEPGKWPYAGPPTSRYDQMKEENARLKDTNGKLCRELAHRRVAQVVLLTDELVKLKAELAKLRASGGPPKWPRSHVDERGEPKHNSVWQRDAAPFGVVQMAGKPGSTERFVIYSKIGGPGTALVVTLGEFLDGRFSPILA